MAFVDLEAHLLALGIAPLSDQFEPIPDETVQSIEAATGGVFPEAVRWLFTRFGGSRFDDSTYYNDRRRHSKALFGWFLDAAELIEAFERSRGSMPDDMVPLANDGHGNFVCVGVGPENAGVVSFYLPRLTTDRRHYKLADSVEDFLRSLHRETTATIPVS
jgi:cell wall assembly regulator SMI1